MLQNVCVAVSVAVYVAASDTLSKDGFMYMRHKNVEWIAVRVAACVVL